MKKINEELPQVQLDISEAIDVVCDQCENYTFEQVVLMKRISAIMSPSGKEAIVPIPTFSCVACGHVNQVFLPAL